MPSATPKSKPTDGSRGFSTSDPSRKTTVLILLVLFLLNLTVNLLFSKIVNTGDILSGEEASVSIRDVFLFPYRLQHNTAASNWGGHLYYWLSFQVIGSLGLFYGRYAKAFEMAFLAPVFFLVLRQKFAFLKVTRNHAFFLAVLVMLLPGIVNYSWMATENGAECLFGIAAILAVPSYPLLAAALAAFSALTYGAGLAFTPVVFFLISGVKEIPQGLKKEVWIRLFKSAFVYGMVLMFPLLWWKNPAKIIVGGGEVPTFYGGLLNLKQWFHETWLRGGSYYYFSKYPAFSYIGLLIPILWGMILSIRQKKGLWIWIGFFCALALYILAGRESGMRRGVPSVVFLAFFMSFGILSLWQKIQSQKVWRQTLTSAFVGFSILFAGVQYAKVVKRFYKGVELWTDYDFTTLPKHTMKQTLRVLLDEPARLGTKRYDAGMDLVVRSYEPDRIYAMMYILQNTENVQPRPPLLPLSRERVFEKIKIQNPVQLAPKIAEHSK